MMASLHPRKATTGPIEVGLAFASRALLHGTPAEIYDTKIIVQGWLEDLPVRDGASVRVRVWMRVWARWGGFRARK